MSHRINNIDPKDTQNTSQKGFIELNRMNEGGLGFKSSCTYPKNPERLTLSFRQVAFLRTCCLGKIARRFLALRRSGMAYVIKLRRTSTALLKMTLFSDWFFIYRNNFNLAFLDENKQIDKAPIPTCLLFDCVYLKKSILSNRLVSC